MRFPTGPVSACFTFLVCLMLPQSMFAETIVDFETLPDTFFDSTDANVGPFPQEISREPDGFGGENIESRITLDGMSFRNSYNQPGGFWSGFAVSQRGLDQWSSGASGGFLPLEYADNNDTVSASGSGAFDSNTWAVAFGAESNGSFEAIMNAPAGTTFESLYVNNTRTVEHVIRNGSAFSSAFGSRNQDELFSVRFFDLSDNPGGDPFLEQVLASYDLGTNTLSVLDDWTEVDLTPLGGASRIGIDFTSTDIGDFDINTPTYVALDSVSVTAIPEPSAVALVFFSLLGIGVIKFGIKLPLRQMANASRSR